MAKIKNAQQYAERYKKRGERAKAKVYRDQERSYMGKNGVVVSSETYAMMTPKARTYYTLDITKNKKPEHAKRYADITDCFPLAKAEHQL